MALPSMNMDARRNQEEVEEEEEEEEGGQVLVDGRSHGEVRNWMLRILRTMACQSTSTTHVRKDALSGALKQPFFCYCTTSNNNNNNSNYLTTCMSARMKDLIYTNPLARMERLAHHSNHVEVVSTDCSSSRASLDGLSSDTLSVSFGEYSVDRDDDDSSDGSSPLGWPLGRSNKCEPGDLPLIIRAHHTGDKNVIWEERRGATDIDLPEIELMKERFAKLLLGEDMSGCGQGVCTALALSNAITNLSACVFGELWKLEPLLPKRKAIWRREMGWLLSVADHIIQMIPSHQTLPDGRTVQVMISKPRPDLQINLPALRKLDAILLDCLDTFHDTEFWYDDKSPANFEDTQNGLSVCHRKQQEKWWLPSPKLPSNGISEEARKRLQHQRESVKQVLKAAMAINTQILSEMDVPDLYWEALPKNCRASLGDTIYKQMVSNCFSSEALLYSLDLSTEHKALDIANRLEASINLWRRDQGIKQAHKPGNDAKMITKGSWGKVKSLVTDLERREVVAKRSENILLCLKQRFPYLPQTLLDITKIQCNRDVGRSILESYSRVLESVAFNMMARIDDVLFVDDATKIPLLSHPQLTHLSPLQLTSSSTITTLMSSPDFMVM